jgi:hypothetical protein
VIILRGILSLTIGAILLMVLTVIFVYARMRIQLSYRVKPIGLSLVREWTLYSPIYWILVIALIIAMYLLFHRWVSTPSR